MYHIKKQTNMCTDNDGKRYLSLPEYMKSIFSMRFSILYHRGIHSKKISNKVNPVAETTENNYANKSLKANIKDKSRTTQNDVDASSNRITGDQPNIYIDEYIDGKYL